MDTANSLDQDMPTFYIGQHESNRSSSISQPVCDQVQQWGVSSTIYIFGMRSANTRLQYDMVTTPITTSSFHSRVLDQLSSASSSLSEGVSNVVIPPLTPADTSLVPADNINQLLAVSSPWIDLCSPDPLISSVSRQVLNMEAAYVSFCGFGNLIVSGPNLHHDMAHGDGLAQYARAIKEALSVANYTSICILLPMVDHPSTDVEEVTGNLARLGRQEYVGEVEGEHARKGDLFGTWDAWHTIRTVCKYSQRLFVGKKEKSQFDYLFSSPTIILQSAARAFSLSILGAFYGRTCKMNDLRYSPRLCLCPERYIESHLADKYSPSPDYPTPYATSISSRSLVRRTTPAAFPAQHYFSQEQERLSGPQQGPSIADLQIYASPVSTMVATHGCWLNPGNGRGIECSSGLKCPQSKYEHRYNGIRLLRVPYTG